MQIVLRTASGFANAAKRLFIVLAFVAAGAAPALADLDKRVALVIGNGAYENAPKLDNPVYDAKAVADSLKRLGFEVIEGYDLGAQQMTAKIGDFSALLPEAKAALVYYAGHGVAFDDDNYLIPIDIVLKTPADLDLKAVNLSTLLKLMKREDAIDVVILDACRNNPFADELGRAAKNRAIVGEQGLARIDVDLARGTLIAFATDPKKTALDGEPGEHSPFTKALLAHLEDPGVSIDTVMNRVRADVDASTKQAQTPWVNTSLIGEFFLKPAAPAPAATQVASIDPNAQAPTATLSSERLALDDKLWAAAEQSNTIEDYQAYIDAVPNGAFVQMAKNRIARLTAAGPTRGDGKTDAVAQSFKTETGTGDTEDALKLDVKARQAVKARLQALGFNSGDANGFLGPVARHAISLWQAANGAPVTGYLGPLQYAALMEGAPAATDATPTVPAATPAARSATPTQAAVKPLKKKKKIEPEATPTPADQAAAAPPAQQSAVAPVSSFLGGVLIGGALGAAIHH